MRDTMQVRMMRRASVVVRSAARRHRVKELPMCMSDSGRIRAGAVEIAYSASGAGQPLVLLHGGESARSQYDTFRPLLGYGIRAIAYDQRDSGDSSNPGSSYGMDDLARDCAALIRGLGYERAHVFGSSYGGALALQIAVTVPEIVQTLTVGATVARFAGASQTATQTLTEQSAERRHQLMIRNLLSERAQRLPEQVAECSAALVRRGPEQHARRMEALFRYDVVDLLACVGA